MCLTITKKLVCLASYWNRIASAYDRPLVQFPQDAPSGQWALNLQTNIFLTFGGRGRSFRPYVWLLQSL
jgi:hypothetical protein